MVSLCIDLDSSIYEQASTRQQGSNKADKYKTYRLPEGKAFSGTFEKFGGP